MTEPSKTSTLAKARSAIERLQHVKATYQAKTTEVTREIVRTGVSGGAALVCGFADQRYGELDDKTGLRILEVNGAPVSLLLGTLGKIAGAAGLAGDVSFALYGAADGAMGQGLGSVGRQIGERFRRKAITANVAAAAPPAQISAATPAASLAVMQPIAVAAAV